jgi:hypothetical protein
MVLTGTHAVPRPRERFGRDRLRGKGLIISKQTYDTDGDGAEETEQSQSRSRRQLLKLAGAAGAAGAVALVARPAQAGAADGGTMMIGSGNPNSSSTTTSLAMTSSVGGPPFAAFAVGASGGTNLIGIVASGTFADLKLFGTGRLQMVPGVTGQTQPTFGPTLEEIVMSDTGILWTGTNNTALAANPWRRINAVRVDAANGTGNAFVPSRLIDTRTTTPLAAGGTRNVTIAGAGTGAAQIPANAIAIFGNLTAVSVGPKFLGAGFMTLYPTGVTRPTVSNVNMAAGGQVFPNFFCCGLGSGQLTVFSSIQTNFLIDVFAYMQ